MISLGPVQLSNLTRTKAWLGLTANTNADLLVGMLMSSVSAQIMAYLERPSFVSTQYTDTVDGQGNTVQFLQNWPVTAVTSVMIDGQNISYIPNQDAPFAPVMGFSSYGYTWRAWDQTVPGNPGAIQLLGSALFNTGYQNVIIQYTAGYAWSETGTLGAAPSLTQGTNNSTLPFNVQLGMPLGIPIADGGVYYLSGGVLGSRLTYVPWTGIPTILAQGTYTIDPTTAGSYYLSAADAMQSFQVDYSFVPYAVEQAMWEWINEIYARKSRPGIKSKSLASQETMSYDTSAVPSYVAMALQPFMSVIPL